jgi:hypothetical protein
MTVPVTAASIQSALAGVSTRLPLDSPLLPLCVSLALECDLTADGFANQWDAFKYSNHLKVLDGPSLTRFQQRLTEDREGAARRRVKLEESRKMDTVNGSGYVVNGGSKRIYTHRDLLDDEGLLSGLIGPLVPRVKREEAMDLSGDGDEEGEEGEDGWRRSEKEERNESDVFTTPAVPRHRSALPPSTASPSSFLSSTSSSSSPSSSLSPLVPLTPSTTSSSLLFTPIPSTPSTVSSAYQSRANPSSIAVTFNAALAPASAPSPSDEEDRSARPIDVEALLSVGELSDLEAGVPFRFMYAKEEDVKDGLGERLELMQGALIQGRAYQRLAEAVKKEAGGALKVEGRVKPEEEEKKEPAMVETSMVDGKEEKKESPLPIKVDPDFDLTDDFDDVGLSSTSARSQQSVIVAGRICIDANSDDSKLTLSSVSLEGSLALSGCHRINLRLGTLSSYSLFPGQIVLAKGVNAHGTAMVVEELLTSAPPPRLSLSTSEVSRYNSSLSPLVIAAAAGPFTTNEDLRYQPLSDLIQRVNELRVDVLILQGPFVDIQHPQVVDGSASVVDLFADFWPELFSSLNPHTRLVVQPSTREALHVPIFPQPPMDLPHPRHGTTTSS